MREMEHRNWRRLRMKKTMQERGVMVSTDDSVMMNFILKGKLIRS
jgi:hypothetical protein